MKKYQIFATSALLLILANYWHLINSNSFIPRSADYIAYGFFIFGLLEVFSDKSKKKL